MNFGNSALDIRFGDYLKRAHHLIRGVLQQVAVPDVTAYVSLKANDDAVTVSG